MADDINNLILNVKGREEVERLREAIEKDEESLRKLIAAHGQFDPATQASAAKLVRLNEELKEAERLVRKTSGSMAGVGQAAMEVSRGLEDLQYGLGGVVNNIPGVVMALGGTAGLTAAISLVAVAANQLVKHWPEFMGLFTERNPVPQATDTLVRYKDALEKTTTELDALKKMTSLSADETARFNRLTQEQADLQKKVAEEAKKQADLKQLMESRGKEDTERGQVFEAAAAGRGPRLRADLIKAQHKIAEEETRNYERMLDDQLQQMDVSGAPRDDLERAAVEAKRLLDDFKKKSHEGVADYVDRLLVDLKAGKANATKTLQRMMDAGTGVVIGGEGFRKAFDTATAAAEDFDEEAKRIYKKQMDAKDKDRIAFDEEARRVYKQQHDARLRDDADFDREARETFRKQMAAKAGLGKPGITRQIAAEDASIKAGGYIENAQALLAQATVARNQGVQGFKGRTDDQIFAMVQREVATEMRRRNPRMGAEEQFGLSTRATAMARDDLSQKMIAMNGTELNSTGRLIVINQRLMGTIQRQAMQAQQHSAAIDRLENQAEQVGQTRLNRRGR